MKFLILFFLLFAANLCFAQGSTPIIVKDTTMHNVVYHVYKGSKGGMYVLRTSAKGNVYKQYLKHK